MVIENSPDDGRSEYRVQKIHAGSGRFSGLCLSDHSLSFLPTGETLSALSPRCEVVVSPSISAIRKPLEPITGAKINCKDCKEQAAGLRLPVGWASSTRLERARKRIFCATNHTEAVVQERRLGERNGGTAVAEG